MVRRVWNGQAATTVAYSVCVLIGCRWAFPWRCEALKESLCRERIRESRACKKMRHNSVRFIVEWLVCSCTHIVGEFKTAWDLLGQIGLTWALRIIWWDAGEINGGCTDSSIRLSRLHL